jgi:hypothetical protein
MCGDGTLQDRLADAPIEKAKNPNEVLQLDVQPKTTSQQTMTYQIGYKSKFTTPAENAKEHFSRGA